MISEPMKLSGRVHLILRDEFGNIKMEQESGNLITTAGKAIVAAGLIVAPTVVFNYIACGTSNTAATVGQTALIGTELARVATTSSNPTSTTTLLSAAFGAGVGTGTIEELGIFSAAAAGTMFSRYLSGTFVKAAGDSLTVSWTITVS